MQKELEFRRRKDEEILSSYSEYQPRIESYSSLSLGYSWVRYSIRFLCILQI